LQKKEYTRPPAITYENPNEKLGENVTLIDIGEYRCRVCNNLITHYRKFDKCSKLLVFYFNFILELFPASGETLLEKPFLKYL
jgi:hypothetical protein